MTGRVPARYIRCVESPDTLALLSDDECDDIVSRIHALRDNWVKRQLHFPVYSLGRNVYLDGPDGPDFRAAVVESNAMLQSHFGDLLERVRAALEAHVAAPVVFDDVLARPGFHVYLAHRLFSTPLASRHFDLQHFDVDWSHAGTVDHEKGLSITLPLALPKGGAGLWYWDVHLKDLDAETLENGIGFNVASAIPEHEHAYQRGHAAVHSGHQLHQIAPYKAHDPANERITLQAHASPVTGADGEVRFILYW